MFVKIYQEGISYKIYFGCYITTKFYTNQKSFSEIEVVERRWTTLITQARARNQAQLAHLQPRESAPAKYKFL